MGLDNRDYLRDEARRYSGGGGSSFAGMPMAPVCKRLIIITIAVFLGQLFTTRDFTNDELDAIRQSYVRAYDARIEDIEELSAEDRARYETFRNEPISSAAAERMRGSKPSSVENWLELETPKIMQGQVWRLLTCAFCHSRQSLFHILFNMLFLFWFGPRLESMYGSKEFLWFYVCSALAASVSYVAIDLVTGDPVPMIGASGAIMGIIMLFAWHFPEHTIYLFFIVPVTMRWMVALYALLDLFPLLQQLSGNNTAGSDNVAHAAHLGGLAFGYLYASRAWRLAHWGDWVSTKVKARQRGFRVVAADDSSSVSRKTQKLADDMDVILKKISEQGEASLTSAERRTLEKASRELRNRKP